MPQEELIPKIDSFLDDVTKTLDPKFLKWLQKYAEMNIAMFAGRAIDDLKLGFVLDTNFALEAIRYYAKDNMPMLQKMVQWFRRAIDLVMDLAHSSQPYAFVALAVAGKFYQNVIDMTEELQRISAAAA